MQTTFFGLTEGGVSALFGSLGSSSGSSGSGSILAEYSSIKNGSYKKLLKAYYNMDSSSESGKVTSNISTSVDSNKVLANIKDASDELSSVANELFTNGKDSVFIKNEAGEYDKEAIYKKVNSLVDAYNELVDVAGDSKTSSVVNKLESIESTTNINSRLLAKVGITKNAKGELVVDKEKFMEANMETVKSLFNGVGSYGYQISTSASYINYMADRETTKASTYNAFGNYNYNYSSGSIYDSWF